MSFWLRCVVQFSNVIADCNMGSAHAVQSGQKPAIEPRSEPWLQSKDRIACCDTVLCRKRRMASAALGHDRRRRAGYKSKQKSNFAKTGDPIDLRQDVDHRFGTSDMGIAAIRLAETTLLQVPRIGVMRRCSTLCLNARRADKAANFAGKDEQQQLVWTVKCRAVVESLTGGAFYKHSQALRCWSSN